MDCIPVKRSKVLVESMLDLAFSAEAAPEELSLLKGATNFPLAPPPGFIFFFKNGA